MRMLSLRGDVESVNLTLGRMKLPNLTNNLLKWMKIDQVEAAIVEVYERVEVFKLIFVFSV